MSWTGTFGSEGSSTDHFTTATATAQLIQSLNLTFLILISWRREKRLDKYSVNIFDAKKSRWHLRCKEFDWQDGILNLNYFLYLDDQNSDIVWGKSLNRTQIYKIFFPCQVISEMQNKPSYLEPELNLWYSEDNAQASNMSAFNLIKVLFLFFNPNVPVVFES